MSRESGYRDGRCRGLHRCEVALAAARGATRHAVGVTSGASVPEELVTELLELLASGGYSDVVEVKTAEEDLIFSLPKELRPSRQG